MDFSCIYLQSVGGNGYMYVCMLFTCPSRLGREKFINCSQEDIPPFSKIMESFDLLLVCSFQDHDMEMCVLSWPGWANFRWVVSSYQVFPSFVVAGPWAFWGIASCEKPIHTAITLSNCDLDILYVLFPEKTL